LTPQEIGLVYNELRTRRVLYSQPMRGRRRSENEVEAVRILATTSGRLGDIDEFLATQGLRLIIRDVQQLGLPGDGLAYIAIRDASNPAPSHVRHDQIVRELTDHRRDESQEQIAVWATFLTLHLLYFLYTRDERPIEAVSTFKDSSVDMEDFLDEARKRVEAMRAVHDDRDDSRRIAIRGLLTGLSDQRLDARVRTFFRAMVSLGVLEQIDDLAVRVDGRDEPVYRQTLWSALDIAENFRRYAPHLLIEDPVEQVETVGTASVIAESPDPVGDRNEVDESEDLADDHPFPHPADED
jgi:hypothetical protein